MKKIIVFMTLLASSLAMASSGGPGAHSNASAQSYEQDVKKYEADREAKFDTCLEERSQLFFQEIEKIRAGYSANDFELKMVRMYVEPVEAYSTYVNIDGNSCLLAFRQMLRPHNESVISDGILHCPRSDNSFQRIRKTSQAPEACNF